MKLLKIIDVSNTGMTSLPREVLELTPEKGGSIKKIIIDDNFDQTSKKGVGIQDLQKASNKWEIEIK